MASSIIDLSQAARLHADRFQNITLHSLERGVLLLTIDRPKVLNALNSVTLLEIEQALDCVIHDENARVLLVTGGGEKAFVAGADIEEMSGFSSMQGKEFSRKGMQVFRKFERLQVPVIALVNGYALGGGCELAMSCDFILASDSAQFGQPEVSLGLTPGFGGTQRLTRLVGRAMAMELLVSGRTISAEEAMRIGLVNHVYPQAQLFGEAMALVSKISRQSSSAVRLTKELVQRGQDLDLHNACANESDLFGLSFSTRDCQEGIGAFLAHRKPAFKGE